MENTIRTYPSPLASYEQVVADKNLFMSTLKKFHSEMSTEFWIPTVRTKNLDLHKLFVEVTSRGGIKQVVHEEKWKDVIDTINIPKTIPMISSRVRKHYYSLLHDYEIVYFSKARGQEWIGFVYTKKEDGYLITLTMRSWKLEGVVYESIEKKVTRDPQKRSYDVFPKLTDQANPQELLKTTNIQVVVEGVPSQLLPPKQNTEADAPIEESEGKNGKEYSDSEVEQRPVRSETTIHMEKSSDLIDTSLWPGG